MWKIIDRLLLLEGFWKNVCNRPDNLIFGRCLILVTGKILSLLNSPDKYFFCLLLFCWQKSTCNHPPGYLNPGGRFINLKKLFMKNKVWFIIGCSTGFGRAVAKVVLAAG
jgi:hypothetical protein